MSARRLRSLVTTSPLQMLSSFRRRRTVSDNDLNLFDNVSHESESNLSEHFDEQGTNPNAANEANADISERAENQVIPDNEQLAQEVQRLRVVAEQEERELAQLQNNRHNALIAEREQLMDSIENNRILRANVSEERNVLQNNGQNSGPLIRTNSDQSNNGQSGAITVQDIEKLVLAIASAKSSNEPKPAVFKEPPPKFSGVTDECINWLKDYEMAARKNNWKDSDKVRHLSCALDSSVWTWYQGLYDEIVPTWDEFKAEFLRTYKPKGYAHNIRRKFYTLRQEFNEKPTDFVNKLLKMRHQIEPKPSDEEIIDCVKAGLSAKYAVHVYNETSLEQIRTNLEEVYRINEMREKARIKYQGQNESSPQKADTNKRQNRSENSEFRVTCFNCGVSGHRSAACNVPYDPVRYKANREKIESLRRVPGTQAPDVKSFEKAPEAKAFSGSDSEESSFVPKDKSVNTGPIRIPVLIGGVRVNALLDTGGSFSLISTDLVAKIKPSLVPYKGNSIACVGANMVTPYGVVPNARIKFSGNEGQIPLTIVHKLEPHIILGRDFLSSFGLLIDFGKRELWLADSDENINFDRLIAMGTKAEKIERISPECLKQLKYRCDHSIPWSISDAEISYERLTSCSAQSMTFTEKSIKANDFPHGFAEIVELICVVLERIKIIEQNQYSLRYAPKAQAIAKTFKTNANKGSKVSKGVKPKPKAKFINYSYEGDSSEWESDDSFDEAKFFEANGYNKYPTKLSKSESYSTGQS